MVVGENWEHKFKDTRAQRAFMNAVRQTLHEHGCQIEAFHRAPPNPVRAADGERVRLIYYEMPAGAIWLPGRS